MMLTNYNPDVLTCLANLSNDEVFTPPTLVNDILDILPAELWNNPQAKFLDPVCKSGVFLREIAKRLMNGLEKASTDFPAPPLACVMKWIFFFIAHVFFYAAVFQFPSLNDSLLIAIRVSHLSILLRSPSQDGMMACILHIQTAEAPSKPYDTWLLNESRSSSSEYSWRRDVSAETDLISSCDRVRWTRKYAPASAGCLKPCSL